MQKIVLNIIPNGVSPTVYVNQFDTGREFEITFKEGINPYNFPSGVTFKINGRKADNHMFEYDESSKWDASHNVITKTGSGTSLKVTIATTEQMTAAAGRADVQITFTAPSGAILGTLNFALMVQERPLNGDPSESDLPDRVESVNGIGPDANGNVSLPPALGAIGAHNIAPVEPTRIMSTARAAGTQVYVTADDQLYNIISPIGAGGTLTPGTNAVACVLSSDLASINETVQIFANGTETYGQLLFRALRDHIVLSKVTPSATLHVTGLQCAYHVTNILSNGLIMGTSTLSSSKPYISGVMMLSNGTGYIATYANDTTTDYSNVVATGRLDFRYR